MSEGFAAESTAPEGAASITDASAPASDDTAQSLDLSQYGTYKVPVKVGGEEQYVPLAEAINGYQRQADYTRKSQEVAELRKKASQAEAIWDAIQRDPNGTIALLAEEFGVQTGTARSERDDYGYDDDTDTVTPQVSALEAKIRSLELREQRRELDRQLDTLRSKYGEFDSEELLTFAMKEGIQSVEAAYKAMTFEKVMQERQELERKQTAESEAVDRKRAASFIESGSSRVNVAPVATEGRAKSIKDAFLRAKQELAV